ncbi:MAG: hypothetical protein PHO27_05150 [Sulfuricurvum sp.]|nr:hypothetical protein [Sulfuricurvum sp.]
MSAVLNLQKNIITGNKSITELLREALFIATKLNLEDFKSWLNNELKGYDDTTYVSDYRKLHTSLKFRNPYHGWQPALINNAEIAEIVNNMNVQQPISEIEYLCQHEDDEFQTNISDHQKAMLMKIFRTDNMPAQFVSKVQLIGIIEHVKTLLLEWALKLEQEGILGDEYMTFTSSEKEKAKETIHIENFNGVMGDVKHLGNLSTGNNASNVSNITIIHNKIDQLIEELKKLDFSNKQELIAELQNNQNDSSKLTATLGKLLTRASEISGVVPFIKEILGNIL